MNRLNRVIERTEINPYTGEREDYYRQLPPDANKDYRLPADAMCNVNLRMVQLQGYDHTKPKPARRERLAEIPQPDGTAGAGNKDAATYARRMGEMTERTMRDLTANKNGERPTWMRDHNRAYGFKGYHDMNRYTPNVPATLRADTKPVKAAADQTDNPNPQNEVRVRGRHRDNSRKPHVERVDYKGPSGSSTSAAPSMGAQTGNDTKRAAFEGTFVITGPSQGPSQASYSGMTSDTRKKETHVRDAARFSSQTLTGVGSSADDSISREVLRRLEERTGNKSDGQTGTVGAGLSVQGGTVQSGEKPPMIHANNSNKRTDTSGASMTHPTRNPFINSAPNIPSANEHLGQKRNGHPTNVSLVYSSAHDSVNAAPVIPAASDLHDNYRSDVGGAAVLGYSTASDTAEASPYRDSSFGQRIVMRTAAPGPVPAGHSLHASSILASPAISRMLTHDATRRAQTGFDNTQYVSRADGSAFGSTTAVEQTHVGQSRKMEGVEDRKGPAGATSLGAAKHGQQNLRNGLRSAYGAVSATEFLHGGSGEGTAFHSSRSLQNSAFDRQEVDKTNVRDLRAEARRGRSLSAI